MFSSQGIVWGQQSLVDMDVATFGRDSGKVLVEVNFSILQAALVATQTNNGWKIPVDARIELWENTRLVDSLGIHKEKLVNGSKTGLDASTGERLVDGASFVTSMQQNGTAYLIVNGVIYKGKSYTDTVRSQIVVSTIRKDIFSFGGVQLGTSLTPSVDKTNPFVKVGYLLLPNPSRLYSSTNSKLCYYTELYTPSQSMSTAKNCEIVERIIDGQNHEMFSKKHQQSLSVVAAPILGSIEVDGLPGDAYFLELSASVDGKIVARSKTNFYFDDGMKLSEEKPEARSEAPLDETTIFDGSEFSHLPIPELKEKGAQLSYVAKEDVRKAWTKVADRLDADTQSPKQIEEAISDARKFIFEFWRNRDRDAGSSNPLSAYHTFSQHVQEANVKFTYLKIPGWRTDFGRIYITYGAPEERFVVKNLHPINSRPFVTWKYYGTSIPLVEGGNAEFDFMDKQGGGNFTLVNSNVRGETYDPSWLTEGRRTN